jgi:hypothetical protein
LVVGGVESLSVLVATVVMVVLMHTLAVIMVVITAVE